MAAQIERIARETAADIVSDLIRRRSAGAGPLIEARLPLEVDRTPEDRLLMYLIANRVVASGFASRLVFLQTVPDHDGLLSGHGPIFHC